MNFRKIKHLFRAATKNKLALATNGVAIILMLETLITLGQTWRAANRNPVESLRYE